MRQLAIDAQTSQRLCNLICSLPFTYENIAELVDAYLRKHFTYLPEEIETLVAPEYMLLNLENNGKVSGDCDDISTLQAAIYKALNIPVKFTAIRSERDNPNYDHVFVEVQVKGMWVPYDVTTPLGTSLQYVQRVSMEV